MNNGLNKGQKNAEMESTDRSPVLAKKVRSAVRNISTNVGTSTRKALVAAALVAPIVVSGVFESGCGLDTRGTGEAYGSGGEGGIGNDAADDTMLTVETGNFPDSSDKPDTQIIFDAEPEDADAMIDADAGIDADADATVEADAGKDADVMDAKDADAMDAADAAKDADVMDAATDSGPVISDAGAPNVTFDTLAMACFKAVVIDDVSKKVVWGSGDSAVCPTELASIYVPPSGYTMLVWVQDPTNNLLSFSSGEGFTISKARCSTYPAAPTWTQIESDYSTKPFSAISNAAVPPGYLFTKSCANDAEYWIHK